MKAVFVDESKSKDFVLCAVFVELSLVAPIRKELASMRKKGQTSVHFVKESPARKRLLLSKMSKMNFEVFFIVCSEVNSESVARERCFQKLIPLMESQGAVQLFIELDENHRELDKRVLTRELSRQSLADQMVFHHAHASQQQLLWIPDALGWTRTRGGDWGRSLTNFRVATIGCD